MNVGDRVVIDLPASAFHGMTGVVVECSGRTRRYVELDPPHGPRLWFTTFDMHLQDVDRVRAALATLDNVIEWLEEDEPQVDLALGAVKDAYDYLLGEKNPINA